jgi:hypothetical protein
MLRIGSSGFSHSWLVAGNRLKHCTEVGVVQGSNGFPDADACFALVHLNDKPQQQQRFSHTRTYSTNSSLTHELRTWEVMHELAASAVDAPLLELYALTRVPAKL